MNLDLSGINAILAASESLAQSATPSISQTLILRPTSSTKAKKPPLASTSSAQSKRKITPTQGKPPQFAPIPLNNNNNNSSSNSSNSNDNSNSCSAGAGKWNPSVLQKKRRLLDNIKGEDASFQGLGQDGHSQQPTTGPLISSTDSLPSTVPSNTGTRPVVSVLNSISQIKPSDSLSTRPPNSTPTPTPGLALAPISPSGTASDHIQPLFKLPKQNAAHLINPINNNNNNFNLTMAQNKSTSAPSPTNNNHFDSFFGTNSKVIDCLQSPGKNCMLQESIHKQQLGLSTSDRKVDRNNINVPAQTMHPWPSLNHHLSSSLDVSDVSNLLPLSNNPAPQSTSNLDQGQTSSPCSSSKDSSPQSSPTKRILLVFPALVPLPPPHCPHTKINSGDADYHAVQVVHPEDPTEGIHSPRDCLVTAVYFDDGPPMISDPSHRRHYLAHDFSHYPQRYPWPTYHSAQSQGQNQCQESSSSSASGQCLAGAPPQGLPLDVSYSQPHVYAYPHPHHPLCHFVHSPHPVMGHSRQNKDGNPDSSEEPGNLKTLYGAHEEAQWLAKATLFPAQSHEMCDAATYASILYNGTYDYPPSYSAQLYNPPYHDSRPYPADALAPLPKTFSSSPPPPPPPHHHHQSPSYEPASHAYHHRNHSHTSSPYHYYPMYYHPHFHPRTSHHQHYLGGYPGHAFSKSQYSYWMGGSGYPH